MPRPQPQPQSLKTLLDGNTRYYKKSEKATFAITLGLILLWLLLNLLSTGEWVLKDEAVLSLIVLYVIWRQRDMENELRSSKSIIAELVDKETTDGR